MVGDKMVKLTLMIRQRRNYYFSLSEEGERVEPELVECRRNFKKCASGSSKTKERKEKFPPLWLTKKGGWKLMPLQVFIRISFTYVNIEGFSFLPFFFLGEDLDGRWLLASCSRLTSYCVISSFHNPYQDRTVLSFPRSPNLRSFIAAAAYQLHQSWIIFIF